MSSVSSVPDAATALLTVKIGDVSRTSRKHLTITTFGFLLSEGLDVFRAKVDTCTDKALENVRGERYVREDRALYMRPGAHSKQAELVEITPSNFENRVARSYRNYLKRKAEDTFQCEVYVYVKKVEPPRRRRLKEESESTPATALHVESQREETGVELAGTLKRKRSMGSEEDNSLQSQQHQTVQAQQIDPAYYRPVRMVVNGAIVPVQVNVQDLLACFAAFQQHTPVGSTSTETQESDVTGAGTNGFHG
ncbi:hypothetical protein F442_17855 [Phytophthora nicotianae P10297]|uniref:Uncharacterized protein n=1 Tax=Phytophthora nicotianae P10297 TaxID=1317064 RepID=W2YGC0_PHYNI|nr:hypothetical protein F442_17855 [Phytophthora nicotianae P10297]